MDTETVPRHYNHVNEGEKNPQARKNLREVNQPRHLPSQKERTV